MGASQVSVEEPSECQMLIECRQSQLAKVKARSPAAIRRWLQHHKKQPKSALDVIPYTPCFATTIISLTKPRYYCKTCRTYWAKGGNLRSLLVGAGPVHEGCLKNKKLRSSLRDSQHCSNGSYMISINQDIHLKLQEQRLATMGLLNRRFTHRNFDQVSSGMKSWVSAAESGASSANHELNIQKPKSISFQNLNSSKSNAFRNSSQTKSWTSATGSSALSTNLEHQIQKPEPSLPKVWCFDNCHVPAIAYNSNGNGNS